MIHERHRVRAAVTLVGDLLATTLAFFLAWYLRFDAQVIPLTREVPSFPLYLRLLLFILLLWPVVFHFHGLYQGRPDRSRVDEVLTLLVAVLLGTLILAGLSAFYRPPTPHDPAETFTYSRAFLGLFALSNLCLVSSSRLALRGFLSWLHLRGHNLQRILVVGAGKLGKEIALKLRAHRELGFEVVGFLDDDPGKAGRSFFDIPVLGSTKDFEQVVEAQAIAQAYIALPLEAHQKMMRLFQTVSRQCVELKLVPDVLQYATLKAKLEDLDGTPVINLSQVPLQGWNSLVKRGMDILLATIGLLILAPILALMALLIWLEDRGPIFYRQERMGLDGKPFMIWKLRTMRVDAESSTGPVWAIRNDPRRTPVGSFLRNWSVDELPQLWNVIKGDMSLVGPRPERPTFVHEFKHRVPDYMQRHRVKAGITGWAQVHGWRGNTSIRKRIQYDLYYIQNWSLGLDVKIIWMTVRYALRHNAH